MAEAETLLKTPLYDLHQSRGGRLVPFAGYQLPVQYTDGIMAEHLWTRENAGLFDVSHMGQVELIGAAALDALEALVPGDLKILKNDRMRYSLFLDSNGGILDDLMITRVSTGLFLVVNGAVKHADIAHLRTYMPDDVKLNYMENHALLALQGPKAVIALSRIVPGVEELTFMQGSAFMWHGDGLWISRSGYTGEDGFEISIPNEVASEFAELLIAQPEVKLAGLGARDSLRLEAGLPLYGHDITATQNPVEADLSFAISKRRKTTKGFPGADKIMDQLLNGASVKRIGFVVEGRQPAREGAEIYSDNRKIGVVTSGGFSPSLQKPIGMGYVSIDCAADNTTFDIDVRGKRLKATVVPMPFVPHRYVRTKTV
jgi:aminomethyltransferase